MTLDEFLSYLNRLEIRLSVDGDQLRCLAKKGVITPDIRAEIADRKSEIINYMNSVERLRKIIPRSIPRASRDKELQLSFAQQRVWFIDKLEPGNFAYNIYFAYRIKGLLNAGALEQSINEIIKRHDVLRTTVKSVDGIPTQVVSPELIVKLSILDFQHSDEKKQAAKVGNFVEEKVEKPFDLYKGPLLRFYLLKVGPDNYLLLFIIHHIIFDGLSSRIFNREVAEFYKFYTTGTSPQISELSIQYADYAEWQREWLDDDILEKQLGYWKQQLKGNITTLELPLDRPRPPVQSHRGMRQYMTFSRPLSTALKDLGKRNGCTMFMTMLAAFQVMLYRYSGQDNIIVGSPIAGRSRSELEGLIGLFLNMLVLRTDFTGNPGFNKLLSRVRDVTLRAFENSDLPFEKLVEEIHTNRDMSRHPLFQVMFQVFDFYSPKLPGLSVEFFQTGRYIVQFDLSLNLWEGEDGYKGYFEYNKDLFDDSTITRMIGHYHVLLDAIVKDPDRPIDELPLMAQEEKRQLIYEFNDNHLDNTEKLCIHEQFERHAAHTPKAVALAFGHEEMTYEELNCRSNQLAHYLTKNGVGPEILVGVYMDRSVEMAIALFGIMKAGGAYVPLDPTHPKERLKFMMEDAGLLLLLTREKLVNDISGQNVQVICLDTGWSKIAENNTDNLNNTVKPENLIYVIYTSGSTGRPKGVQIVHHAMINFLHSMSLRPGITPEDILLAVTTISFDIAGLEIFLPLTTGASVVLLSHETASDGFALMKALEESDATIMQATPATWKLLLNAGWAGKKNLKILCGGEALPRELADRLLTRCATLWNLYGPTETTVWSSVYEVKAGHSFVLIGQPIANTQIYILDRNLNPVPIGVPGELYIGGDGLARGYLNREELTDEKFIKRPFDNNKSGRLYKTGDLARYRPTGDLDYLGRLDFQTKIRGYRIELGEIENALTEHPVISEVVAVVHEDNKGDKRLAAYIIPSDEQKLKVSDLRQLLKEKLPDYMIPSFFITMEKFPLTPNNKIDRKALPDPDLSRIESGAKYVAPRDELELQLATIWQKLLNINNMSINDDFFELGGHSLLAARLFAKIENKFDSNLPLSTLFHSPTIRQIADILRQKDWKPVWRSLVPIQAGGTQSPLFLIHGAEGNVLLYKGLAHYLGKDQPVYGLQSKGLDGIEPLQTDIESMAENYIKEIRAVQPEGPYYIGGYCLGGTIAYEAARQIKQQGDEVALLAMFETYNVKEIPGPWPFYYRLLHKIQNIKFHLDNLFLSSSENRYDFFKEKARVEWSRIKVRLSITVSKALKTFNSNKRLSYHHLLIDKVNDQAQADYTPKTYGGKIVLFRPKKHFTGLNDPDFGWGKLASKGVEKVEMAFNPRGILTEPFVQLFAEKLKDKIAEAKKS